MLMVTVVLLLASAFASFYFVLGGSITGMAPSGPGSDDGSGVLQGQDGGDYFMGSPDAPVTMIEYSDFQCPYCGRFVSETFPQIEQNYIDTGEAKLIFKQFPLPFHSNAQSAAEAAECAGEQGKFWEMHDKLFGNQASLGRDSYIAWAGQLGLNVAAFQDCIDSSRYSAQIAADMQDGQSAGVSGTPSFVINGALVVGAQPYSVFQQAIDQALSESQ